MCYTSDIKDCNYSDKPVPPLTEQKHIFDTAFSGACVVNMWSMEEKRSSEHLY